MTEKPGRLSVGIIGAGKVGAVLGSALRAAGHHLKAVSATSQASKERAGTLLPAVPILPPDQVAKESELVILAVPDDQIGPVVSGFAKLGLWRSGQIVAHVCGAHGTQILQPAAQAGAIPIAIHPAMTFSGLSLDLVRLDGCPWAVTASALALPIAQALVVEMGGEPFVVPESARPLYHAALAHGANHLVTLITQARQALQASGIEDSGTFLAPLVQAALERALSEGISGLTGPVVRGDVGTVVRHLDALDADPQLSQVRQTYAALALATAQLAKENGDLKASQVSEICQQLRKVLPENEK